MAPSLTESNAKFALDVFLELSREQPSGNALFSPVNLVAALGLILSGARGNTAAVLEKILHLENEEDCRTPEHHHEAAASCEPEANMPCPLPEPAEPQPAPCPQQIVPNYECGTPESAANEFQKILAELNKPNTNYELSIANRLYGDKSICLSRQFLFCALKLFLIEVRGADFHTAPEEVRRLINLWVEVQTHGKIKNLFFEDQIPCQTQLLMVNVLDFKGQWEVKFDKDLTKESSFFLNETDTQTVEMMYRRGQYKIGLIERGGVQVLEIPYKDDELSLFILLPKDCNPESLQQVEEQLSYETLLNWVCDDQLKEEDVDVAIPKIKLEESFLALNALEALGLTDVSNPTKADLSGITSTEGVALCEIVHCASLEIDEEGGEEEEASQCPIDRDHTPQLFVADHPFLFFILHKGTQSILLSGRFAKPEEKQVCL